MIHCGVFIVRCPVIKFYIHSALYSSRPAALIPSAELLQKQFQLLEDILLNGRKFSKRLFEHPFAVSIPAKIPGNTY